MKLLAYLSVPWPAVVLIPEWRSLWLIVCITLTVCDVWGPVKDDAPFLDDEVFIVLLFERAPEFVLTFAPPIFAAYGRFCDDDVACY